MSIFLSKKSEYISKVLKFKIIKEEQIRKNLPYHPITQKYWGKLRGVAIFVGQIG